MATCLLQQEIQKRVWILRPKPNSQVASMSSMLVGGRNFTGLEGKTAKHTDWLT